MRTCLAALVQMCAVPDLEHSVALAARLTREALSADPDLVVLPENHCGIGPQRLKLRWAFDPEHPHDAAAIAPFVTLSERSSALIVLGGVPERHDGTRVFNTSLVLRRGEVVATYRKIHMFDCTLPDGTELRESEHTAPGARPVVVDTPLGRIGLSICYDLRFAELYRALSSAGAEIMLVPSAFTDVTGAAHWEPLVRARAIESQAYVLAAAQHGHHMRGRRSHGHSMVVDPWGTVVAEAADGDGVVLATLDADRLTDVRSRLPALTHRRIPPETSAAVVSLTESDEMP